MKSLKKSMCLEGSVVAAAWIAFASILFFYYIAIQPYTYGDTAFLVESLDNLAQTWLPFSKILSQNAAAQKMGTIPIDIYCKGGIEAANLTSYPYNWLTNLHSYIFLYLITPVAKMLGSLTTLSLVTSISFASVPIIAYVFLRSAGLPIHIALLSGIICVMHPAWLVSANGQFYVDRFFIPLSMLYCILVFKYFNHRDHCRSVLLMSLLIGLVGGFTSERNMLVTAMFSLTYAVTAQAKINKRLVIFFFGIFCAAYVYLYMKFMNNYGDNASVQSGIFNPIAWMQAAKVPGMGEYLLFNSIFFIFSIIFYPRVAIPIFPILIINCIVTIGGAEKNGWATHYHSHYYGLLTASFLIAVISCYKKYKNTGQAIKTRLLFPVLGAVAVILIAMLKYYPSIQAVTGSLMDFYVKKETDSNKKAQIKMFERITNSIEKGASVTGTEWGMSALNSRSISVSIFPVGLGISDYVMIQGIGDEKNFETNSAFRYFGPDTAYANKCLIPFLKDKYKLELHEQTWYLFKRI